ncbi:MAG: NAD(P)/FAD-dependent oxidoreductase [Chloroflexi bacterium]|nr:NAD(P)/FAD-dependent oxidoreductase [Chloroflexota bacterium]
MTYDVIIAGASFAGLAVAAQLGGKRVLLLDRKPIGAGQTSACGTLVSTLESLGLQASIRQVHKRLVLHTAERIFAYPVAKQPFCTFDYAHLCRLLRSQSDAEFLQAPALALEQHGVQTPQGTFAGDIVVDATGWRAALAVRRFPGLIRDDRLNFGLETSAHYQDDGLHFWYDPGSILPQGVAWAFPAGDHTRVGVGSYAGETRLKNVLDDFLGGMNLGSNGFHGGYFPHALRPPLVDNVFLVGDAAGQCLALTGEGIRPALFFGTHLGVLLRRLLAEELDLQAVQQRYRTLVEHRRWGYEWLCRAQRMLPRLPLPVLKVMMGFMEQPIVFDQVIKVYTRTFRLDAAEMVPALPVVSAP